MKTQILETRVAIIGASGVVGRTMLEELEKLEKPLELGLFASKRSAGTQLKFHDKQLTVQEFSLDKLKDYDYALMSAGGAFSRDMSKALVAQGTYVIDNSSAWRQDPATPLIIPEVNGSLLNNLNEPCIIANPNCSTIQLVVCLKPLTALSPMESVQVSTYQAVSGAGQQGLAALEGDLETSPFPAQIKGNVIPYIGELDSDGHCEEELKIVNETRKILDLPNLEVVTTTVRVPVAHCHSEAVAIKFQNEVDLSSAKEAFLRAPSIIVAPNDAPEQVSPLKTQGLSEVFVSRIRQNHGKMGKKWLQFFNVADNLKKGAATNAVQILQQLLESKQNKL